MKCCYIKEWFVLGLFIIYFLYRLDEMLLHKGMVCSGSVYNVFCVQVG